MSVQVKICGITNVEDALVAAQAGADALGFVFFESSPRHVTPECAARIISALPAFIVKVGVFVNAPEELVVEAATRCGLNILQFHGEESPEQCLQYGLMTMKAFRISGPESLSALASYPTDAFLLDAYTAAQRGGSGERFDWDLAIEARKSGRPIFLAGGLTPENVAEAVRRVQPYGVDVSSGVESSPGRKDHAKVAAFVKNAKTAGEPG